MLTGGVGGLVMRKPNVWILLADSSRARVVRSPKIPETGTMHEPLETVLVAGAEHRPLREIMSDAPGRTFSPVGDRRSAMEYHSDPVRDETTAFARSLLDELECRRAAGEFDELVICAPPRMLGAIHDVISEKLRRVVRAEVAKDLTKLSEAKLRDMLQDLVAGHG
jgi:protein required for attachment to host cells